MNDNIQYIYEIYAYDQNAPCGYREPWSVHFCATEEIAKYLVAWEEAIQYDKHLDWIGSEDWLWCKDKLENFNDSFVHWQDTEIKFGIREQELILK